MEKIAVLLPVYAKDNCDYLKLSIESILNQTYSEIILFIGVDGAIGNDLRTLLEHYDKRECVVVEFFPTNRGLAAVLNDLLQKSLSYNIKYIARMDADDISLQNRFQKQYKYLSEHPDIDVIGGAIEEIDENSVKTGKCIHYPMSHNECFNFFRYRDPLAHPAVMFKKSFFEKVKGYRTEYRKNQDTMLWYDGFMNGCHFGNIEDVVLLFRVNKDFYRNRRGGLKRAKKMLSDRFVINKSLHYDPSSYVFALLMFLVTISPAFIRRLLYRIR